jgi:SMC interacting uncharacterized protein involved in chromosome segregation
VHIRNYQQLQAKNAELEKELLKTKLDLLTSYGESEKLSGKIAELEEEILIERSNGDHWRDAYSKWVNTDESARRLIELQEQLASSEQRVAEACALQVATETKLHWLDAARVAKEIRSGEWRKFVKGE